MNYKTLGLLLTFVGFTFTASAFAFDAGSGDAPPAPDDAGMAVSDASFLDTGVQDSGVTADSGVLADSGVMADSGVTADSSVMADGGGATGDDDGGCSVGLSGDPSGAVAMSLMLGLVLLRRRR